MIQHVQLVLNKGELWSIFMYNESGHWCFSSYKVLAHAVNETTNSAVGACIENIK